MAEEDELKLPMNPTADIAEDNWIHRATGMLCGTCMWFVSKEIDTRKDQSGDRNAFKGRCRKHAPTLNGWPVVFENDWCGDHKLK